MRPDSRTISIVIMLALSPGVKSGWAQDNGQKQRSERFGSMTSCKERSTVARYLEWRMDTTASTVNARVPNPPGAKCGEQAGLTNRRATENEDARREQSRVITAGAEDTFISVSTLEAPKNARKAYEKAVRELAKKRPDLNKVASTLEKAVAFYPRYALAWNLLGVTRLALEQQEPAREAFERALAIDSRYADPYLGLAWIELRIGRMAKAAQFADAALNANPVLTRAHLYRALASYRLGNYDAAKRSIRVILDSKKDRRYPVVYGMLGDMFALERNFQMAAVEYEHLIQLDPDSHAASLAKKNLGAWQARGLIR